jgi:hypothetical protein
MLFMVLHVVLAVAKCTHIAACYLLCLLPVVVLVCTCRARACVLCTAWCTHVSMCHTACVFFVSPVEHITYWSPGSHYYIDYRYVWAIGIRAQIRIPKPRETRMRPHASWPCPRGHTHAGPARGGDSPGTVQSRVQCNVSWRLAVAWLYGVLVHAHSTGRCMVLCSTRTMNAREDGLSHSSDVPHSAPAKRSNAGQRPAIRAARCR